MGGRLALYMTCAFPERFTRVVLESASPGLKTAEERQERVERDDAIARKIQTISLPDFLTQWYSNPLFASLQNHPDAHAAMLQRRQNNSPTELANALRGFSTGVQPPLWGCLPHMNLPLLLISGTLDSKFVAINHDMIAHWQRSNLLQPTIQTFDHCGHNVHLEAPVRYRQAVLSFLTRV